jgi:phosphonatase-like hydrolase
LRIGGILFDLIGTTVQEKDPDFVVNCFRNAFEEFGVEVTNSAITNNRGKDKMEMINLALAQGRYPATLGPTVFESFKRNMNNGIHNFAASEGVNEAFNRLRLLGVKVGLGSGLSRDLFDKIIKNLNWHVQHFDYIGLSAEVVRPRPYPDMILDMIRAISLADKSKFLKVGDTIADIEEGKNAGVRSIAVLSGTQSDAELIGANPDFVIRKISEIVQLVESL